MFRLLVLQRQSCKAGVTLFLPHAVCPWVCILSLFVRVGQRKVWSVHGLLRFKPPWWGGGDFSFRSQMLRLARRKPHSGVLAPESSSSLLGGQPLLEKDYINQPHVSITDLFSVPARAVAWWDNVYSESLPFPLFTFFLMSEVSDCKWWTVSLRELPSLDGVPPERSYSDPTLSQTQAHLYLALAVCSLRRGIPAPC